MDSETNILQLPTEVMIEIFEYIQYRDNVRLVCHRFYEIICLMENIGEKITIHDERMVNIINFKKNNLFNLKFIAQRIFRFNSQFSTTNKRNQNTTVNQSIT